MTARPPMTLLAAAIAATLAVGACGTTAPTTAPTTGATAAPGLTQAPVTDGPPATGAPGTGAPTATGAPRLDHIVITLEPFASVPGRPLALTAPDDGTGRLFVAAQDGSVWVVERGGAVLPDPMLDMGGLISRGGEQGLLGIAVHPSFPTDPRVFVNYTNQAGDTIVASLSLDPANPNRLDPGSRRELLFVDQPYANHNGGAVAFGSDGYLYVSLGDGGSGGDPQGNGQSLRTLLGKIVRMDVDSDPGRPYVVPADNPFANGGGLPEIWHSGLRNPWRLSFDRATGDLWIGDVGQGLWEEVDVARAGVGGLNFGWKVMEGAHCYDAEQCATEGLTPPIAEYGRDLGCTVIGGYVYRGTRYPFLAGAYLFADYCTGRVFAIDAASDAQTAPVTVGFATSGQTSAFGEDADGELYVIDLGGEVSRVVAAER